VVVHHVEVHPVGAGLEHGVDLVAEARERIARSGRDIRLEVDGGVKVDNIAQIAHAGADTFVAGSAIFGADDYSKVISAMRGELAATGAEAAR